MRIEMWVFCNKKAERVARLFVFGGCHRLGIVAIGVHRLPLPRGGAHIVECTGGFPAEGALVQEGMMIDETTHE